MNKRGFLKSLAGLVGFGLASPALANVASRSAYLGPVVLTEADALADLHGYPRPDNPTIR